MIQLSTAVRNARANQIEIVAGASPILRIRTGAPPASCGSANTGTVLATVVLPANWMTDAVDGVKQIAGGPWQDVAADATGTAGHFRLYDSTGTTCHAQGVVTGPNGGGDLVVSTAAFAAGVLFSVLSFTLTEANA
jgi:hypothetical protein